VKAERGPCSHTNNEGFGDALESAAVVNVERAERRCAPEFLTYPLEMVHVGDVHTAENQKLGHAGEVCHVIALENQLGEHCEMHNPVNIFHLQNVAQFELRNVNGYDDFVGFVFGVDVYFLISVNRRSDADYCFRGKIIPHHESRIKRWIRNLHRVCCAKEKFSEKYFPYSEIVLFFDFSLGARCTEN